MNDRSAITPAEGQGFEFPGRFEVTAMGQAVPELEAVVLGELAAAGVAGDPGSVRQRESSGGRYRSVSVSFECDSRERLAEVHRRLRANALIKWTL